MSALLLQVGTGQRLLDVPGTELLSGGAARIGWDFGVVAPFVGGNVTRAQLDVVEEELVAPATLWTVSAGVRFDAVEETELLQPFAAGGLFLGGGGGRLVFEDGREEYGVEASTGPGGFLGAGADARLAPALAIGVEVGAVLATADVTVYEQVRQRRDVFELSATGIWSYADLHLVFRPGGGK